MKRILAFLMLLVLLAVCYGCGETKIDPVLVPITDMLPENSLPRGLLDDESEFVWQGENWLIMNLDTGECESMQAGPFTKSEMSLLLYGYPLMGSSEYVFLTAGGGVLAIDRNNWEHSAFKLESIHCGVTSWNEVFCWNYKNGKVILYNVQGEIEANNDFGEYGLVTSVSALDDGFLILCRDEHPCWTDPEAPLIRAYEYTLVITDRKLNVRSSKMIGAFDYLNGCLDAGFQVSGSDDLLLCLGNNILLFDTKNGKHKVLVIEDDKPQFVAYENTEEMLERIREYGAYLSGVSADGKFALYSSERRQDSALYMIDLKSMKVTLQMTEQELRDIGINTDNHPLIEWHGGEYLEWEGWLYRLVDRSTLPEE